MSASRTRARRGRQHDSPLPALLALIALAGAGTALAAAQGPDGRPSTFHPSGPPAAELLSPSTVTFRASDPLETFTGQAPIAAADLAVDPADPASARGTVTVRTHAITTGNVLRDENAHRGVLDTTRYPTARFRLGNVLARPAALPDGGTSQVSVSGTLTLHGVTRKVKATGTVTRRGQRLDVVLHLDLRLTSFGMHRPRFLFIRVDDLVKVTVDLALHVGPANGP